MACNTNICAIKYSRIFKVYSSMSVYNQFLCFSVFNTAIAHITTYLFQKKQRLAAPPFFNQPVFLSGKLAFSPETRDSSPRNPVTFPRYLDVFPRSLVYFPRKSKIFPRILNIFPRFPGKLPALTGCLPYKLPLNQR